MVSALLTFGQETNPMRLKCFHKSDSQRDWSSSRSRPPRSREELDSATEVILGHFTSSIFLENILQHGLMPDIHKERAVDDRVPSDNESVYLTATYDRLYPERAVVHHGGRPIVVEVLVDRRSIVADEGALSPHDLATCAADEALYLSLCLGACKHPGPIPLASILSITYLDGSIIYEGQ